MGKTPKTGRGVGFGIKCSAIFALSALAGSATYVKSFAGQAPKAQDAPITVRYTDMRQAAGITFLQDSTANGRKVLPGNYGHRRRMDRL